MSGILKKSVKKQRLETAIESGSSSVGKLIQKEGDKVKVQIKPISAKGGVLRPTNTKLMKMRFYGFCQLL